MADEGHPPSDDLVERLQPRLGALFRTHGVAPDEAEAILQEAVAEIRQRAPHPRELEHRLLHAIETRCRRHSDELRRQIRAALERAEDLQADGP